MVRLRHFRSLPSLVEHFSTDVSSISFLGAFLWSGSVDSTIRVWDLASGKCAATFSAIGGAGGHTDAVSCLELVPNAADPLIASGSADKTVKLWKATGGTLVHTCVHSSMVTSLKAFKDGHGGVQVLIIGLLQGTIVIRSCLSMKILFNLDQSICHTKAIWSLVDMGHSCFGAGSDDGNVVVWTVRSALVDK
jgi:WD40 repeat protein